MKICKDCKKKIWEFRGWTWCGITDLNPLPMDRIQSNDPDDYEHYHIHPRCFKKYHRKLYDAFKNGVKL
jgi:hypothetical protein